VIKSTANPTTTTTDVETLTTALVSTANTVQTSDVIVGTLDQMDRSVCCQCMDAATPSNGMDKVIGCQKDPQCEAFVCDFDDYCCTVLWDKTCSYYASEKCDETSVVILTTQTLQAVAEEEDGWNIDIIWKVSLAVFGVMAACIMGCCAMLYIVKCFCNKKRTMHTMDFETNTNGKQTNALPEAEADDNLTRTDTKIGTNMKQQRGKSMDHYHVRVAVKDEDDDDEEADALHTVSKKKRQKKLMKRRKKIKIDDEDDGDEDVDTAHPLFDRKCRSNSF